jgi:hypothetical protein
MKFEVIEIDRYHDEHLIESTINYADARKAAFDYWKNLFPCDKRDSQVEVRFYKNDNDYDVDYCLRLYNYPELSNESLFDLYNGLDYEIFELAKEITRRCGRLEEWLDADDENEDEEILIECLEMLI